MLFLFLATVFDCEIKLYIFSSFAQLAVMFFSRSLRSGSQRIHRSTKSTIKCTESMHFMITKFARFHF